MKTYPVNEGISAYYIKLRTCSTDILNQGGTTKASRLSSLAWDERRFLLLYFIHIRIHPVISSLDHVFYGGCNNDS
jgi:hypothetical protein